MINKLEYSVITDPRYLHQLVVTNNSPENISLKKIKFTTNVNIQQPGGLLSQNWQSVKKINRDNLFYDYELTLSESIQISPGQTSLLTYAPDTDLGTLKVGMPPRDICVEINNEPLAILPISLNGISQQNPHPEFTSRNYHADWGQYANKKTADDEPYGDINSLNYAFIGFNEQGDVFALDSWGDSLDLPKIDLARRRTHYLDFNIAFGGWTNAGKRMDTVFSDMANNPETRRKFVKNAVDAVEVLGANGIDIDWEYPASKDAANFVSLMTELRAEFNRRHLINAKLTIAAPAGKHNITVFSPAQWQEIALQVNEISIMTYDYFGAFSEFSDFHAAVNLSPQSPHYKQEGENAYFCITKTLALYQQQGIDPKKLVLGIPNYCRSVIVNELGPYQGLYQPVQGAPMGEFGQEGGIFSWNEILKKLRHQPSELDKLNATDWQFYDSQHPLCKEADMCLLVGKLPDNRYVVLNFLDPNGAYRRAMYARSFAGTMVWANYSEADEHADSFMNAISYGLENRPYHFETQVNLNTRYEGAGQHTSQRKTELITKINTHIEELESDQKRNHIIFNVLKFVANFLPVKVELLLLKPLLVAGLRKFLNVDGEKKNIEKMSVLGEVAKSHTARQVEAIISENFTTLNQHRNPFKRLLTAILPRSFIATTKWLQTDSFKMVTKLMKVLPIIEEKTTVANLGNVQRSQPSCQNTNSKTTPQMIIDSQCGTKDDYTSIWQLDYEEPVNSTQAKASFFSGSTRTLLDRDPSLSTGNSNSIKM
ncbi:MAG: hypothetical protein H0U71_03370 [Gammaproteobacteria bacterium]|nr:hypothetical protein [Gammaproteobacteria bacterium]